LIYGDFSIIVFNKARESTFLFEEMVINEIHILATDKTPEFILNPEGIIKIRGRGLFGSKTEVSKEIKNWIDAYLRNPAETTYVIIAFEYLNSFSTTILVSILKKLLRVTLQTKKLIIQWYYEEGDEDILERGEYISSSFDLPIEFIQTNNIADEDNEEAWDECERMDASQMIEEIEEDEEDKEEEDEKE
jgi:hypothetical protein